MNLQPKNSLYTSQNEVKTLHKFSEKHIIVY